MRRVKRVKKVKTVLMDHDTKTSLLRESLQTGKRLITDHLYGESMWPLLTQQDQITVIYLMKQHLKLGDIILFQRGSEVVAHRLLKIKEQSIITQGDTLKDHEEVDLEHYIGVVISIHKRKIALKISRRTIQLTTFIQPYFRYLLALRKVLRVR